MAASSTQALSREEAQRQFEKFVARWNKGQLEDMYYGEFGVWLCCLGAGLFGGGGPSFGGLIGGSVGSDAPNNPTNTIREQNAADGVPAHLQQQCHQTQHKWGFAAKLSEEVS